MKGRLLAGAVVAAASLCCASAASAAPTGAAPDGPGAMSHFDLARKDCVGTARNRTSDSPRRRLVCLRRASPRVSSVVDPGWTLETSLRRAAPLPFLLCS